MNRTEREAASLAEIDRLAVNIRQARKINRTVVVVLLLMAALLVGFNWPKPAEAAKRAVYKGMVTICYAPSAKSDPYGQYLQNQWVTELAAAVKKAKVGKVKVVKERYPLTSCYGEVWLASAPTARAYGQKVPATAPYGVYKYAEAGVMWESQVVMGDKVGAKATAAQRQAWLVAALQTAIPR
jgi:hypothetical protein